VGGAEEIRNGAGRDRERAPARVSRYFYGRWKGGRRVRAERGEGSGRSEGAGYYRSIASRAGMNPRERGGNGAALKISTGTD